LRAKRSLNDLPSALVQPFGICSSCEHQRLVTSGRGSAFSMCEVGLRDPDWPKYPPMPVLRCPRFLERSSAGATDGTDR